MNEKAPTPPPTNQVKPPPPPPPPPRGDDPGYSGAPRKRQRAVPVASIHNHVNLFRDPKDPNTGAVTVNEQIHAIERFIRWHERQVVIGRTLLAQLRAGAELEHRLVNGTGTGTPAGITSEHAPEDRTA